MEFNVLVFSGSRFTSQMYPVTLSRSAANGNLHAVAQAQGRMVTLGRFRAFGPDPDPVRHGVALVRRTLAARGTGLKAGCGAVADGKPKEDLTRIGEVHVGSTSGLSMQWNYHASSDTTLSVGLSTSSDTGPWSIDGSYTTTNSLGGGGGYLAGRKTLIYSDGDMWYQRYIWTGGAPLCAHWTNQVVSAVGDSRRGFNSPPRNPYGGCNNSRDPHGHAVMDPSGGSFDQDRAVAWGYSGDATVWNFTFGGHTGFTNSIHHQYMYHNPGGGPSYVCGGGSGMMPDSKILYSSGY